MTHSARVHSHDTTTTDIVSPTPSKRSSQQLPRQTPAEYKYVASKNSKVFHHPECRWAKRIAAKNLVRYKSRQEAIEAGKRPCKVCKP